MLDETRIVQLLKQAYESKLPAWKSDYTARICKNLQVHTKGLLFSKVDTLFPHEHPDSKAHCINTYEPITKGSIWKAINNIIRIFSSSSFTVTASDNALEFVNESNFDGKNLFSFFLDKWTQNAIAEDPNSLIAVYPQEYLNDYPGDMVRFIKNQYNGSVGTSGATGSTGLIKHVSKDMVVFISEAESEKEYIVNNTIVKRELFFDPKINNINGCSIVEQTYNQQVQVKILKAVYHIFTPEYFIRFMAVSDKEFDYDIYYYKSPIQICAFPVTGVNQVNDINVSFVDFFIPFGNLALLQHRNHRAVDLMFSYPRMSEIQTPCDNSSCNDGFVKGIDPNTGLIIGDVACSRCRGSGFITIQSPYKVYQKRIDTGLNDPEAIKQLLATAPVDFHTPDVGILDYSKNSWKEYLSMAEEAVFIQQKQMTGNIESALAKQIDKEGEYSWIQNISKALNADLAKVIQCIENHISAIPVQVSLEQPISFAVVTESEAFDALNIILSSPASIIIKTNQVENFINKFVSKSSPIVKAIKVLKFVDPLLFYSTIDIQIFKSNNVVTTEAWTTHVYAYSILMQMYEADKTLFDKEEQAIADMVIAKIPKPQTADLKTNIMKAVA